MYSGVQVISRRTSRNATATKTKTKLNPRQPNASVRQRPACDASYRGPSLCDWYQLTCTSGTPARCQSLSPTRQLALQHLEAQDRLGPREHEAMKSLTQSGASGNRTSRHVNETHSVLDIERLARRADKRRDEVGLHLISHDPNSSLFRAALSPMLTSYQLAPRPPSQHQWL